MKLIVRTTAAMIGMGILAGGLSVLGPFAEAQAADIKLLTFLSSRPVLEEAVPAFERASGHKVTVVYGSVEPQRDLIAKGEVADVVITSRALADDLNGRGRLASVTEIARITMRMFVRAGAPKPDISTVEAFKASLLKADSIAFTDPARGALAGRSFANALKKLEIYDQVLKRAKIISGLGHDVIAAVARGEAAMGASPAYEVRSLPKGIDILGLLPKEIGADTPLVAAILKTSPAPAAAAEFIKFLKSPAAAAAMTKHGLEP